MLAHAADGLVDVRELRLDTAHELTDDPALVESFFASVRRRRDESPEEPAIGSASPASGPATPTA